VFKESCVYSSYGKWVKKKEKDEKKRGSNSNSNSSRSSCRYNRVLRRWHEDRETFMGKWGVGTLIDWGKSKSRWVLQSNPKEPLFNNINKFSFKKYILFTYKYFMG